MKNVIHIKKEKHFIHYILAMLMIIICIHGNTQSQSFVPKDVEFKTNTLKRIGHRGDNWCITWVEDGSQITSMCDGNWLYWSHRFHNHLYRIRGEADNFKREHIPGYPHFSWDGQGWFGYGIYAVNGNIYSMVSRTQSDRWSGPFRGMKMLKSPDNGQTWYRMSRDGEERLLKPDDEAREEVNQEEIFFLEEFGETRGEVSAYPFSFCSFVQNGRNNNAAKDQYVYIYAPEGAYAHRLLLARVHQDSIEMRKTWEYFNGWNGNSPTWTDDINKREAAHVFPEKNENDEYFGWYSWLPSIVWNPGLNLYIMVNGGTYAGDKMTGEAEEYFKNWMHKKTGSLGFWYSENPYGPWKKFYYTDYWTVDDPGNRTYQPKLSPKWISEDGSKMILIWSDAMRNEEGRSHQVHYKWNQMEIEIKN